MLNKIVEVKTEKNLILFGNLFSNNNDSCVLFIPGMAGNFFDNNFCSSIANALVNNNIDFLFSHNQGSFLVTNFKYDINGVIKHRLIGSAFENYEESNYDIDAWVKFLINKGYKKVYLIAHSLGCNKIIKYLKDNSINEFKMCILLAPQDLSDVVLYKKHPMYNEAIELFNGNQKNKILSYKFLDSFLMSSGTFLNFVDNINLLNNLPYKNNNGDFEILERLNIPIYTIIGSKDLANISVDNMDNLYKHIKTGKYRIINGAKHNFNNYEEELSSIILSIIKNY